MSANLPILRLPSGVPMLPDSDQWINRFEIRSETSSRVYVVSQNKAGRFWGCSCPGWRTRRRCKHLSEIGVPNNQVPFEAQLGGNR